jgi:HTH-type transcriptional regulator/antitoxin HigA
MNIKPIKTEKEYKKALKVLERLFDSEPGTPEGEKLEALSIFISHYEDKHFPIEDPDPIEAIKFRMEQFNMKPRDLGHILGYRSRASEILKRKEN